MYEGNFDASQLITHGDVSSLFASLKQETLPVKDENACRNVALWTSQIHYSGVKKLTSDRIFSMCVHPSQEKLLVRLYLLYD